MMIMCTEGSPQKFLVESRTVSPGGGSSTLWAGGWTDAYRRQLGAPSHQPGDGRTDGRSLPSTAEYSGADLAVPPSGENPGTFRQHDS